MPSISNNPLQSPIEYLKGVGPARADILKKELGIFTFEDLLHYYPYKYVDRTTFYKIAEIQNTDSYIQFKAHVLFYEKVGPPRKQRLVAKVKDDTGTTEVIWFKGVKWVEQSLEIGAEYVFFGKPNIYRGKVSFPHPEFEKTGSVSVSQQKYLQPFYHTTEKMKARNLDSKQITKLTKTLLANVPQDLVAENLPQWILDMYRLPNRSNALRNIHFPADNEQVHQVQNRLKFEELFFIQLRLLRLKDQRETETKGITIDQLGKLFNNFYANNLPFELTGAQKRVLKEIRRDIGSGKQMNRLIQGDVGSGKTIVALMSILMIIDNGYQTCLMAPTEILAAQHFEGIQELVKGLDIQVALLTGSTKTKERNEILENLKEGKVQLLIGTHALIEDKVVYKNLGLAVIDEQHRFGVMQRGKLWQKGAIVPHILIMTATPIPRTLALNLYGDLNTSVIDELPPGRKAIQTIHKTDAARLGVFDFMRQQIQEGRQIYVVYPLIEESDKLDYKDLMDGYESICRAFPLPDYRVSIVHGKMKPDAKDEEMRLFVEGKTQIMVATTVIEVGVNVPNASVMVIESAERFGLSQLHQLRGRVGRGSEQSFCILMTKDKLSTDAYKRIKTMTQTNDGFKIAEVDLEIRGPGDLMGTQQSGMVPLKIANIVSDGPILEEARKCALQVIGADPNFKLPENRPLRNFVNLNKEPISLEKIG